MMDSSSLSTSDIVIDTYLIFHPHNSLPQQIFFAIILTEVQTKPTTWTRHRAKTEIQGIPCIAWLLGFLLVKYTARCKLRRLGTVLFFSPLYPSQSLASSPTLREC